MNGLVSTFTRVNELGTTGLRIAISAGLAAALLAVVVLTINVCFRRWLTAGQMGLLWSLVLVRLMLPGAPSSSWSLQNVWPSAQSAVGERGTGYGQFRAYAADAKDFTERVADLRSGESRTAETSAAIGVNYVKSAIEFLLAMLPWIWLTGGISLVAATLVAQWRLHGRVQQITRCRDSELLRLWEECCEQAGVRVRIPILLCDEVQQPAIMGLFRPLLLLPSDVAELNASHLRMIMLHELAHVRRWDVAVNWLLVVVRAVHWWNPIYWLAAERLRSLREQSCDAFAIRHITGQPTREYRELLLTLAERRTTGLSWRVVLPASMLEFYSSYVRTYAIHNRLRALRRSVVSRSRWQSIAAIGLVGLVAISGLTNASTTESTSKPPNSHWLPRLDYNNWNASPPIELGPDVTRAYDLEKSVQRIAGDIRPLDEARAELYRVLPHLLRGSTGQYHAYSNEWAQERLQLDGYTLTVKAPLKVHTDLARYLDAWEQSGLGQICIQTRIITDERDLASANGISWQYLEAFSAEHDDDFRAAAKNGMPVVRAAAAVDAYLPTMVATLNRQQASAFLLAAQGNRQANVIQTPKVTFFNGAQACVSDCTQSPFIVGIQDLSAGAQQPKIAVIDEGIKLTCRATHNADATKVQLEARVDLSAISDVRTASILLRGTPTTIQLPRVKRYRIDVASEVPDGESLLVGCMPTDAQAKYLYVLLTVLNVATK